jgi:hypothetical protein
LCIFSSNLFLDSIPNCLLNGFACISYIHQILDVQIQTHPLTTPSPVYCYSPYSLHGVNNPTPTF